MTYIGAETRFYLIDPVLREKGYDDHQWLKLETPAAVESTGPRGRRRRGSGRTDFLLLCYYRSDNCRGFQLFLNYGNNKSLTPIAFYV